MLQIAAESSNNGLRRQVVESDWPFYKLAADIESGSFRDVVSPVPERVWACWYAESIKLIDTRGFCRDLRIRESSLLVRLTKKNLPRWGFLFRLVC